MPKRACTNMSKKLYATTDFYDEIFYNGRLYREQHIAALMGYLRSLGVSRLHWVIKQTALHERGYPGGFDLLATAVQAAHACGIELHAVFKPFEGCFGFGLPHAFPPAPGDELLDDLRGPMPVVNPFVARHPHLRFKRRPGPWHSEAPLGSIALIKGDDAPTRLTKDDLSIWTGSRNDRFERYDGPWELEERIAMRPGFPLHYKARVLRITGLNIPADQRYLQVRCARSDAPGDFTNHQNELVELRDVAGHVIACTPGCPPRTDLHAHDKRYASWALINPYFRLPQVRDAMRDPEWMASMFRDYCSYDSSIYCESIDPDKRYTLDERGMVTVARGKNDYLPGVLHPIYPAVRAYWLDWVQFCIDRGVDGVNFRTSNHSDWSHDRSEYGFNEPLLEACGGRIDRDAVARLSGDAYTGFLAEARDLLKRHNRAITMHVEATMLAQDARSLQRHFLPPNVDWQWERWIREIADAVEIRALFTLRPAEHDLVIDRIARVAREAGKPVIYQSTIKELGQVLTAGCSPRVAWEMACAREHPGIDAYMLYETASFTRLDDDGELQGAPALADMVQTYLHGAGAQTAPVGV